MTRAPKGRRNDARLAPIAVGALLVLVACGGDDAGDRAGNAPPTTGDQAATVTTAPDAPVDPVCEETTVGERRAILCTAGEAAEQGLVVALHGRGSSPEQMQAGTQLDTAAALQGWAVVYPEALDGGWGDDTFVTPTRPAGDEDVVFLDRLVDELRADPRIADATIGLVGFSNGASMALRYAAARPDEVRGVVSVAGQLPRDPAIRPTLRLPLLEVYGTADPLRPYASGIPETAGRQPGQPTPTLSTAETVAAFVDAPTASGQVELDPEEPVTRDPDPGDGTSVTTQRWTDDNGTVVVLRSIDGGGHTWPSSPELPADPSFGVTSRDVDATADALAFLLDPSGLG